MAVADIRQRGTVYFDTSLKETRHGRHIRHNKWRADITIRGKRYRMRSRDKNICYAFLEEISNKANNIS